MSTNGKQNEMVVIYKTTDYGVFKHVSGNRVVQTRHLNHLIVSIGKRNLLEFNPILVNEKMEVIDGQHRLAAAKANKWDIYYRMAPGLKLEDVQLLNAYTKSWTMKDYLDSYMSQGNSEYTKIRDFMTEYGVSLSLAITFLRGKTRLRKIETMSFKAGNFVVLDQERAEDMMSKVLIMKEFCYGSVWQDREFLGAFFKMLETVKLEDFLKRAREAGRKIESRNVERDYLRQLEDIYNFGMKTNAIRLY